MMSNVQAERIAESLEQFIRARFSVRSDDKLFSRSTHLFEDGYVDSTGLVELVAYIESEFEIGVPEDAFFDASFTSIDGIASAVALIGAEGGYKRVSYVPN
jgi:acyl carrier protein